MNAEAEPVFLAGVDKALLIALATPIAYLFAFQYDRGYLNFFGVPDILVDVSLRDLLIALVAMASVGCTVYVLFESVLIILPEHWPQRIQRRSIKLVWTTVIVFLLLHLFDATGIIRLIAVASIATLSFFLVALPIKRQKNTPAHNESTNESPRTDAYAHKGVVPELLRRGIQRHLILGILGIALVCFVANIFGDAQATMQTVFPVHATGNGNLCAVVRMRDTDLLCVDFDIETRQLTGNYQFLKSEGTTLSLREIGRLHTPESRKSSPSLPNQRPYWLGGK
ncbi:MAG: hypothetical protein JWN63_2831 [Candidatus Acidoferrum typicum]|nr:hypothetical protein [Candidatus Acidoferrum typicum]